MFSTHFSFGRPSYHLLSVVKNVSVLKTIGKNDPKNGTVSTEEILRKSKKLKFSVDHR